MSVDLLKLLYKTSAYKTLEREMKNPSHTYLLISEDEDIIPVFFHELAIMLLCNQGFCRKCATCKKILSDTHADVHYITKEKGLSSKDVSELIMEAYTVSVEGGKKLFFFYDFGSLSPIVQNKLLKTLEEPPKNAIFFLAAKGESSVLNTVKSRAKKVYVDLFSQDTIYLALKEEEISDEAAEISAKASGGLISKALKTAFDEKFLTLYKESVNILLTLKKSGDIAEFFNNVCFTKDNIDETLDIFQLIMREILKMLLENGKSNVFLSEEIQALSQDFSKEAASYIIGLCVKMLKEIKFNVRIPVVVEQFLFNILEAKYKWQK